MTPMTKDKRRCLPMFAGAAKGQGGTDVGFLVHE
jgi:hypothetical protein